MLVVWDFWIHQQYLLDMVQILEYWQACKCNLNCNRFRYTDILWRRSHYAGNGKFWRGLSCFHGRQEYSPREEVLKSAWAGCTVRVKIYRNLWIFGFVPFLKPLISFNYSTSSPFCCRQWIQKSRQVPDIKGTPLTSTKHHGSIFKSPENPKLIGWFQAACKCLQIFVQ